MNRHEILEIINETAVNDRLVEFVNLSYVERTKAMDKYKLQILLMETLENGTKGTHWHLLSIMQYVHDIVNNEETNK